MRRMIIYQIIIVVSLFISSYFIDNRDYGDLVYIIAVSSATIVVTSILLDSIIQFIKHELFNK